MASVGAGTPQFRSRLREAAFANLREMSFYPDAVRTRRQARFGAGMRSVARSLIKPLAGLLVGLLLSVAPAAGQEYKVFAPGGIALSGYDAVSYFTKAHPLQGTAENALRWRGATWYFSSPDTLESFEMDPTAYAPQFGGYCVYGLAEGHAVASAPGAFVIYHGKLYMMQDANRLAEARSHLQAIVAEAESHWPDIIGQIP